VLPAPAAPTTGVDQVNVYAAAGAGALSPMVRGDPALVYVPNSMSDTVDVISQRTFKIVASYPVGALPQHVTPSYDLRTLYADNDEGNSLTPIDPRTGRPRGRAIPVTDPYNLYFTPDGRYAIVVAEAMQRLDFRDANSMRLHRSLDVPQCRGVDHLDFSADGRYLYASCEFSGRMIEVDVQREKLMRTLTLAHGVASPQDVKLAPDGRALFVADQAGGGLWEIDPYRFRVIGFLHTGAGAHGLYPSRDGRLLYVSNRAEGTISIIDFTTRRPVAKWTIPQPASPDMGGVSADGSTLWLSGRYNSEVYAIDTRSGRLRARIPVGQGPHGLCVWPQPGRYSLGHTGNMR
jgi:DNA-binding beta-propeller fold protein YncE